MTISLQGLSDSVVASRLEIGQQLRKARQELLIAMKDPFLELKSSAASTERAAKSFFAKFEAASKNANLVSRSQSIVDSLHFEEMQIRQSQIPQAYEQTNNWIFQEGKGIFRKWLESLTGVFWISGKAGSGKSMLSLANA